MCGSIKRAVLENLRVEFINLVNGDPPEESIQEFIEKNPILLHQFPSEHPESAHLNSLKRALESQISMSHLVPLLEFNQRA